MMMQEARSLKRCIAFVLLIAVFLGSAVAAWSDQDRLRSEVRQFHSFLRDRPKVSSELRSDPKLVNNKRYLDQHDDLKNFLKRHPQVKQEIVNHPSRVFGNYYR